LINFSTKTDRIKFRLLGEITILSNIDNRFQGDSGGPLQVVDNGMFVLAGIYSFLASPNAFSDSSGTPKERDRR
jgi:hypothetical protein